MIIEKIEEIIANLDSSDIGSRLEEQLINEEKLMGQLGLILYGCIGEEYPQVLESILGILNVICMANIAPPIKDILSRLTPILKIRKKVSKAIQFMDHYRLPSNEASFEIDSPVPCLCISKQLNDLTTTLKTLIKSRKLLHGYTLKVINRKLYLWW
ncbi:unnamed protein product [Rotaria socialis]|uniref:Uncharacterized protein n=2 Tax=Rotaria socialis TaxID=392032 RepID=A0A821CXN6_9BILA|nr:unnamed protein product [Rotaria socialis]